MWDELIFHRIWEWYDILDSGIDSKEYFGRLELAVSIQHSRWNSFFGVSRDLHHSSRSKWIIWNCCEIISYPPFWPCSHLPRPVRRHWVAHSLIVHADMQLGHLDGKMRCLQVKYVTETTTPVILQLLSLVPLKWWFRKFSHSTCYVKLISPGKGERNVPMQVPLGSMRELYRLGDLFETFQPLKRHQPHVNPWEPMTCPWLTGFFVLS